MSAIRVVDVVDEATFGLIPPCADPGFDHRSCDYWEDADRGSKAARLAWLEAAPPPDPAARAGPADNPFVPRTAPAFNPFAATERSTRPAFNPFADDDDDGPVDNPFAPPPPNRPTVGRDVPRKLGLLGRGLAVFGSYVTHVLLNALAGGTGFLILARSSAGNASTTS